MSPKAQPQSVHARFPKRQSSVAAIRLSLFHYLCGHDASCDTLSQLTDVMLGSMLIREMSPSMAWSSRIVEEMSACTAAFPARAASSVAILWMSMVRRALTWRARSPRITASSLSGQITVIR